MLCDKRVPLSLKGKVYRMVVRPAVLYGSECWPIKKTGSYTIIDRNRNDVIRDLVKVASIEDKMRNKTPMV